MMRANSLPTQFKVTTKEGTFVGDLSQPNELVRFDGDKRKIRSLPEVTLSQYEQVKSAALGVAKLIFGGGSGASGHALLPETQQRAEALSQGIEAWVKAGRPDAKAEGDLPKELFAIVSELNRLAKVYANPALAEAYLADGKAGEDARAQIDAQLEALRVGLCNLDSVHALGDQLAPLQSAIEAVNAFSDAMGLKTRVVAEPVTVGSRTSGTDSKVLHAGAQIARPLVRYELRLDWEDPARFVELNPAQQLALDALGRQSPVKAESLLLFTDPNKDPDDLVTLMQLKELQARGFVKIDGAILTTLGSYDVRMERARFAKGVLNWLGLPTADVGVGIDYNVVTKADPERGIPKVIGAADHVKFLPAGKTLLAPTSQVHENGLELAIQKLRNAPDGSVNLVVIAGNTDAAALMLATSTYRPSEKLDRVDHLTHPKYPGHVVNDFLANLSDEERAELQTLFQRKVKSISMQSGADKTKGANGFVAPDGEAYNSLTDYRASQLLYDGAQSLGVPVILLDKGAAATAAVSPQFYDNIAETNLPPAVYLRDMQYSALEGLYTGIADGHIPRGFDFFFNTFTDLKWVDRDHATLGNLELLWRGQPNVWDAAERARAAVRDLSAARDAGVVLNIDLSSKKPFAVVSPEGRQDPGGDARTVALGLLYGELLPDLRDPAGPAGPPGPLHIDLLGRTAAIAGAAGGPPGPQDELLKALLAALTPDDRANLLLDVQAVAREIAGVTSGEHGGPRSARPNKPELREKPTPAAAKAAGLALAELERLIAARHRAYADAQQFRPQIEALLPIEGRNPAFQEVWAQVTRLNLYDPMALLASIKKANTQLYVAEAIGSEGAPVSFIGAKQIRDPRGPESLIGALAICSARKQPEVEAG